MGKRFKKILRWIGIVLVVSLVGAYLFSPFNSHGRIFRSVEASIVIDAPVEQVFSFMGNSNNAKDWSVYVNHISALNEVYFTDGSLGSKRRCFRYTDESKQRWDEEIIEVVENKVRRLTIFNLKKFPMMAEGLQTEQLYRRLGPNSTQLSLTLFYKYDSPSFWELIKTKFGAYEIQRIFKGNLENIKRMIESKHE